MKKILAFLVFGLILVSQIAGASAQQVPDSSQIKNDPIIVTVPPPPSENSRTLYKGSAAIKPTSFETILNALRAANCGNLAEEIARPANACVYEDVVIPISEKINPVGPATNIDTGETGDTSLLDEERRGKELAPPESTLPEGERVIVVYPQGAGFGLLSFGLTEERLYSVKDIPGVPNLDTYKAEVRNEIAFIVSVIVIDENSWNVNTTYPWDAVYSAGSGESVKVFIEEDLAKENGLNNSTWVFPAVIIAITAAALFINKRGLLAKKS